MKLRPNFHPLKIDGVEVQYALRLDAKPASIIYYFTGARREIELGGHDAAVLRDPQSWTDDAHTEGPGKALVTQIIKRCEGNR